jgi:hypothetical protein
VTGGNTSRGLILPQMVKPAGSGYKYR